MSKLKLSKRERRQAPDPIVLPEVVDNLKVWDRRGRAIGDCLRGLWAPNPAFLVGSGRSLHNIDFARLRERGVMSLGINNSAGYVPCRAFVCADPVEKFHHGIWFDPSILKFVPYRYLAKRIRAKVGDEFAWTRYKAEDCPNVWGVDIRSHWEPTMFFATEHASWGVNDHEAARTKRPKCIFTFFAAIRLLHYLGVKRIYMIGVDFEMLPGGRVVGNYAFPQGGAGTGNNEHYRHAVVLLQELQPVFDRVGLQLYNCNPQSRLTLWPFVPFDKAIEDCRGGVPCEPFDLSGWYEKGGSDD